MKLKNDDYIEKYEDVDDILLDNDDEDDIGLLIDDNKDTRDKDSYGTAFRKNDGYKELVSGYMNHYEKYSINMNDEEFVKELLCCIENGDEQQRKIARTELFNTYACWLIKFIAYKIKVISEQDDRVKQNREVLFENCFSGVLERTTVEDKDYFEPKKSLNYKAFCMNRCVWLIGECLAEEFASGVNPSTYSKKYIKYRDINAIALEGMSEEEIIRLYNQKLFLVNYQNLHKNEPTQVELACFLASKSSLLTTAKVAAEWAKEQKVKKTGANSFSLFLEYNTDFYKKYFNGKHLPVDDAALNKYLEALPKEPLHLSEYMDIQKTIQDSNEIISIYEPIDNNNDDEKKETSWGDLISDKRENVEEMIDNSGIVHLFEMYHNNREAIDQITGIPDIQKRVFCAAYDQFCEAELNKRIIDFKKIAEELEIPDKEHPDEKMAFRLFYSFYCQLKKVK